MSIITLDFYKEYAGITNPKEDDKLQVLVDHANSFITTYCGVSFVSTSKAAERNTCSDGTIFLEEIPVVSVDEIRVMSGKTLVGILDLSDTILEPAQGIINVLPNSVQIPNALFNVEVDYSHGYLQVPPAVRLAALELVTYFSKREFNKSRNIGGGETAQFADPNIIPTHIRAVLDLYRRI